MERRHSNLELLRIVSILMIIVFHCAYKSGFSFEPGFSANKLIVKTFWMLGELGVNLFMLISGYFMVSGRFKWKKLIRLLAEVQFYNLATFWIGSQLGLFSLGGLKSQFLLLFPVTLDSFWFITAYLLVYILSPYLNILIRAMDERTHRRLLLTVLVLWCVIPTVFGFLLGGTEAMLYYNRFIWLVIMYFIGAYIYAQNHNNQNIFSKVNAIRLSVASAVVLVLSILLIDRFHIFFEKLGTTEPAYFWPPNTIPMVCLSVGLFVLFLRMEIPYSPAINAAASTTLGIYLLHDGHLRGWLWRSVFRCAEHQNSPFLVFRILGAAAVIFAAGTVIDLARQRLEHRLLNPLLDRALPEDNINGGMAMKVLRERFDAPALRLRGVRLFCVFFLAYVFLGLCISWQRAFNTNIFFGADNARAFEDLTLIDMDSPSGHYRIAVHPLFLLLAQTPVLLVDGVVNRPEMSVILVEACCGALSVCLFDGVLGRKGVERRLRTAFTLIYGSSFSMVIFSTVPETFAFAALGLVSFWYFLAVAGGKKGPLSGREKLLAVFFGVVSFGVTLTNYVFYLVGLVYLLLLRYRPRSGAKEFIKLNVFNGAAVVAGCLYQRFVWREAPLFWSSIIDALWAGQPYEETRYMNWECSLEKTVLWLKEMVLRPLLSPDIYLHTSESYYLWFSGYRAALKALLVSFWMMVAVCLAFYLARRFRDRFDQEQDGYLLGLLAAYAGNLILHYIYGIGGGFIYSPHHLFYILLAAPLALERSAAPARFRRVLVSGLLVFWVVEVLNNLSRFFQSAQAALGAVGSSVNMTHSVKGTVMCGVFLLAALLCWDRLRSRSDTLPQKRDTELAVCGLWNSVLVYSAAVLVTSLFVAFNH